MTQRYTVTPQPIATLFTWIKSGEIAIPEIQRPFVWDASKVRDLLDSLYQGFPVGYLIAWRNPNVRLKDGTLSAGKRILIDGQQRVTALMAALLGREILTRDYVTTRIKIAFHPVKETFEVFNPAIAKDPAWLPDVAALFAADFDLLSTIENYSLSNPDIDRRMLGQTLHKLEKIENNQVGLIELAEDLDIETVTRIFIRVNSAGASLSQADFVMSKIAADEKYGGNHLRKAIDYFCRLSVDPAFLGTLERGDKLFAKSEYMQPMRWVGQANDDLYDPSYTDMLRVAFTSKFSRGRLSDLVALLSGRNFEAKNYEETIAESSFSKLKGGVLEFMNKNNFECFTMILRSAGFVTCELIGGMNAIDFAYVLYLRGRTEKIPAAELERLVRRWYAMSMLRGRYTNSPETAFDLDIRQIESQGLREYTDAVIETELPDSYWTGMLPQLMETSSSQSPYLLAYKAAQAKLKDKGFLSRDILVQDMLLAHGDLHHIFPQNFLKKQGLPRGRYNQMANLVIAQTEINIKISDRAPEVYFHEIAEQCSGGRTRYGGITDMNEMKANFRSNCIPEAMLSGNIPAYDEFLHERRKLMAVKIQVWLNSL